MPTKSVTYVGYARVSTHKQGIDGLGIDAQKEAMQRFLTPRDRLVGWFIEVESGKNDQRVELAKAIERCKLLDATLLIAKLDRLARDVHFVTGLMKANIKFVSCDMPEAGNLMIHLTAAFAEEERRQISERTSSALRQAKLRGVVLGGYRGVPPTDEARSKAREAVAQRQQRFFAKNESAFADAWTKGGQSFGAVARLLNEGEVFTVTGRPWSRVSLRRYFAERWVIDPDWLRIL